MSEWKKRWLCPIGRSYSRSLDSKQLDLDVCVLVQKHLIWTKSIWFVDERIYQRNETKSGAKKWSVEIYV